MTRPKACILVLSTSLAASACAADPMFGTWCAVDGTQMMHVDEQGLGFNDHTVCEVDQPTGFTDLDSWTSNVECRGFYFQKAEDGTLEVVEPFDPWIGTLKITRQNHDLLNVDLGDGDPPVRYERCEPGPG